MPIDPYAALHALLRAEAVRNAPHPAPAPVKAQTEDEEDHKENPAQTDR
ncbi:hypothetical protein AB0Q95_28205 [Streptomyces sp. NPDC059900]